MFDALLKAFRSTVPNTLKGVTDSWTPPHSYPWTWWQQDLPTDVSDIADNTTVEACVATISQSIAQLPIKHYKITENGGAEELQNSNVARVLRTPNPFQTKSEFFVDIIRKMLLTGNGYGVCTRNNRFEINAIYPQLRMTPAVSVDNQDVYYTLGDETLIKLDSMVPSRDVLHLKMHTKNHPLIGCTPLEAAYLPASTSTSIQGHANALFKNRATPSSVLSTPMTLTKEQVDALRQRVDEQLQGLNSGGTMILTNDMKFNQVTMSSVDAELINTYKLSIEDIARVFRVPPMLIGIMDQSTFGSTEQLMKHWVATGLGFVIEHLENSLERLFNLPYNERIEFDTDFILQADFKSRMEGYKVGITGGFLTPNLCWKKEHLPPLPGGAALYLLLQNVPLELTGRKLEADIAAVETDIECQKKTCDKEPEPAPAPESIPLDPEDKSQLESIQKSMEEILNKEPEETPFDYDLVEMCVKF